MKFRKPQYVDGQALMSYLQGLQDFVNTLPDEEATLVEVHVVG